MRTRALLHRNKLEDFKKWLLANGYEYKENQGTYEILRWKGKAGQPIPMIYDRDRGDHLTASNSAYSFVRRFIRQRKEAAKNEQS